MEEESITDTALEDLVLDIMVGVVLDLEDLGKL